MRINMNRREFLGRSAGSALALSAPAVSEAKAQSGGPKKAVLFSMLPDSLDLEARFRLAKDVGFEGVEAPPINDEKQAKTMRDAAEKAGIRIHSVIFGGWEAPLSSPDPAVAQRGLEAARAGLQSAKWMGADDILLVPAIVDGRGTRYQDAYTRSQKQVRALIPTAEKLNIMILIEEVWNKFLLSPLEYAHYIDSFKHPLVQSYFDVGNVVLFAYPEDWIRTLGKRIKRVHLKDFKRGNYQFVPLREGDIDWPEVRKAFSEIGYSNFMTTELGGGDEAYLREVSSRVDKILAGS